MIELVQIAEGTLHRCLHGLINSLLVLFLHKTFEKHICQHRYRRNTHHTTRFIAHQVPDRQEALLLMDVEHRLHPILLQVGEDQRSQRMEGAIGIPKRPSGIVAESSAQMIVTVGTAIITIHVAKQLWGNHHVIERRVKRLALTVGMERGMNATKLVKPTTTSRSLHAIKVPVLNLSLQIGQGIFGTHTRHRHLYQQRLSLLGAERSQTVGCRMLKRLGSHHRIVHRSLPG